MSLGLTMMVTVVLGSCRHFLHLSVSGLFVFLDYFSGSLSAISCFKGQVPGCDCDCGTSSREEGLFTIIAFFLSILLFLQSSAVQKLGFLGKSSFTKESVSFSSMNRR
jgi:hypothetical protein